METLFCKNPIIKSYLDIVSHGTYQTSLIDNDLSIYLCFKSDLFVNLKKY